jgi:hypothetical protein
MTKRLFSFAKLHKDGQEVPLCDDWTAHFRAVIEPHRCPPYLTVLLVAQALYAGKVRTTLRIKDAVVFPRTIPRKCREPLVRLVWEAYDVATDEPSLDRLYFRLKEKGQWPPPQSEWIKKGFRKR